MHILKRLAAGYSLLVHFMGYISYSAHSHVQLFKNRQYDLAKNLPGGFLKYSCFPLGFKYQSAFLVAGSLVESATIAGWYPNILMANMFISALILSRFEPGSADPGDPRGVVEANGSWCRCHDHATEHPPTGWEQSRQRYLFRFLSAT